MYDNGTYSQVATQTTPNGSGVSKTVDFAHLKMNSNYKVQVICYNSSNVDITKAGTGVSTVNTTNDNVIAVAVGVTLADVTFDGAMHPTISVATGSVVDTASAEAGTVANNP